MILLILVFIILGLRLVLFAHLVYFYIQNVQIYRWIKRLKFPPKKSKQNYPGRHLKNWACNTILGSHVGRLLMGRFVLAPPRKLQRKVAWTEVGQSRGWRGQLHYTEIKGNGERHSLYIKASKYSREDGGFRRLPKPIIICDVSRRWCPTIEAWGINITLELEVGKEECTWDAQICRFWWW